ncbi:MAG: hypothetical protein GF411_12595 [Candidatus Lokiarchaeota archaeon]|nr:hypothetical protein [Candidatus Lokiarchaeota archaeon]
MSSIWNKVWKSTPKIDCNLCGFMTCANFSRNVVAGNVTPLACPVLTLPQFTEQIEEISKVTASRRSIPPKVAAEIPEGGVLLTKPCRDTTERVMAELRISNGLNPGDKVRFSVFDSELLCELIECIKDKFESLKCSTDLGYGRADTGELSITLLHDGRINMRRVLDKESVIQLFREIEHAIFGAMICNCCGSDFLSILTGRIEPQLAATHTVFDAGTTFSFEIDFVPAFSAKSIHEHASEQAEFLLKTIQSGLDLLDDLVDGLSNEQNTANHSLQIEQLKSKVVSSLVESDNFGSELGFLITLSCLKLIGNAMTGLIIVQEKLQGSGHEGFIQKLIRAANQGESLGEFPEDSEQAWLYAQLSRLQITRTLMNPFFSS